MTPRQTSNSPRDLAKQERRRAINRHRLGNGLRALIRQPWKLALPVLVVALAFIAYLNRSRAAALLSGDTAAPKLAQLWEAILAFAIVVFAILSLLGVLALLGRPRHAKQINAALLRVGLCDRYGVGPALLSSRAVNHTAARTMEFYSKGISLEVWEDKGRAVEDVLNLTFVEPPHYGGRQGNHRNYVVLTIAPGAATDNQQPLYDDEFC